MWNYGVHDIFGRLMERRRRLVPGEIWVITPFAAAPRPETDAFADRASCHYKITQVCCIISELFSNTEPCLYSLCYLSVTLSSGGIAMPTWLKITCVTVKAGTYPSADHVLPVRPRPWPTSHTVRAIYTSSDRLNFVDDLWKADSTCSTRKPQIVVLNVGSNDLAHIAHPDPASVIALIDKIVTFAKHLQSEYGVSVIVINSVLPRDGNMQCNADTFLTNSNHFNTMLEQWCDSVEGLVFNHMRGFYRHYVDKKEVPLPVSHWTSDGIHCNETYARKFHQRLRFAILHATTILD